MQAQHDRDGRHEARDEPQSELKFAMDCPHAHEFTDCSF
jgi:hypothetical protein